jgi:hypothetical protein
VGETSSSKRATSFINLQASGNYICNRKLITQQRPLISFPKTNLPWKPCQITSSISEPTYLEIPYVVWTTINDCIDFDFCAGCTDLYDRTDLINAVQMPRFLCNNPYGTIWLWLSLIAGMRLDFCAHHCMENRASPFSRNASSSCSPICYLFSECL